MPYSPKEFFCRHPHMDIEPSLENPFYPFSSCIAHIPEGAFAHGPGGGGQKEKLAQQEIQLLNAEALREALTKLENMIRNQIEKRMLVVHGIGGLTIDDTKIGLAVLPEYIEELELEGITLQQQEVHLPKRTQNEDDETYTERLKNALPTELQPKDTKHDVLILHVPTIRQLPRSFYKYISTLLKDHEQLTIVLVQPNILKDSKIPHELKIQKLTERIELPQDLITPEIAKKIVEQIQNRIQQITDPLKAASTLLQLAKLSVLRCFNIERIERLLEQKNTTYELIRILEEIGCAHYSEKYRSYTLHPDIRTALQTQLQTENPAKLDLPHLHEKALTMFRNNIEEIPENCYDYLLEALYHIACLAQLDPRNLEKLEKEALKLIDGAWDEGNHWDKQGLENLQSSFNSDPELRNIFGNTYEAVKQKINSLEIKDETT